MSLNSLKWCSSQPLHLFQKTLKSGTVAKNRLFWSTRPTQTAHRDHCFRTCRPSVPTFQNLVKQNKAKTMFETVGLGDVDHWRPHVTCCKFWLPLLISQFTSSCFDLALKAFNEESMKFESCFVQTFFCKSFIHVSWPKNRLPWPKKHSIHTL